MQLQKLLYIQLELPETRALAVIFSAVLNMIRAGVHIYDDNMLTSSVVWQSEHLCLNMWAPLEGSPAGTCISSETLISPETLISSETKHFFTGTDYISRLHVQIKISSFSAGQGT